MLNLRENDNNIGMCLREIKTFNLCSLNPADLQLYFEFVLLLRLFDLMQKKM